MKQSTGMSITSLPVITMRELCKFNIPLNCEIHVGSEDWQSNPDSVLEFARLTGINAYVVSGSGHSIKKDHIMSVLDSWLKK